MTADGTVDGARLSRSTSLLLIRHAEAHYRAADGRYLPDGPLTERGVRQAQALAEWLPHRQIERAWVSPCERAEHTALLAGLAADTHPGLAEWRFQPYVAAMNAGLAAAEDPMWIWQQATGAQHTAPETLDRLVQRIDAVLDEFIGQISDGGSAVIVAHGHLLRVLTTRWLGLPPGAAAHMRLAPASLSQLTQEGGHRFLATWNLTPWQPAAGRRQPRPMANTWKEPALADAGRVSVDTVLPAGTGAVAEKT